MSRGLEGLLLNSAKWSTPHFLGDRLRVELATLTLVGVSWFDSSMRHSFSIKRSQ